MGIGIDISQFAYKNTGVAYQLYGCVSVLLKKDEKINLFCFFPL